MLHPELKSCYKQCTTSGARPSSYEQPEKQKVRERTWLRRQRPEWGRRHMDLVTIAVIGVIVISYLVGSLTSSVETEQQLPHRY